MPLGFFCSANPLQSSSSYGNGRTSCVPVFPSSAFDMVSDPGRISPAPSTSKRWLDLAPTMTTVKASAINDISRLNTYLQQSLSTLHANISIDYARLASGGWRLLSRQDCLPAGKSWDVSFNQSSIYNALKIPISRAFHSATSIHPSRTSYSKQIKTTRFK